MRSLRVHWLGIVGVVFALACDGPVVPIAPGTPTPPQLQPAVETPDLYAEELVASPSWARRSEHSSNKTYASQVPNPAAELDSATLLGPDFAGVMLCHVEVTERKAWDATGLNGAHMRPDINVAGGSGEGRLHVIGPDDSYTFVASFPSVRLDHGFTMRLVDRDPVSANDPIETLTISPPSEAQEIVVTGESSAVRCRGIPQAEAALRAQGSLDSVAPLLVELEALEPLTGDEAIHALEPARVLAREAAAWVGWTDTALAEVVRRLDRVAALWKMVEGEALALPAGTRVELGSIGAQVVSHRCSGGRCSAQVQASYGSSAPTVSLRVLTPEGILVCDEVSSDPARQSSLGRAFTSGDYTHTFEWVGDEPAFVLLRQRASEAYVRLAPPSGGQRPQLAR